MRFACEQCQTKYTIPDERVRGKILKIRCKNCNCQITISEGGVRTARPVESGGGDTIIPSKSNALPALGEAGGDATMIGGMGDFFSGVGSGVTAGAPAPAAAAAEEWYISVDGTTAGPMPLQELAQRVITEEKTPDRELFVWREGLGEWRPPSEVDEVKQAVTKERRLPAAKAASQPAPAPLKPVLASRLQAAAAAAAAKPAAAAKAAAVAAPAAAVGDSLSDDNEDATQIGSLSAPAAPPASKGDDSGLALDAVDFDVVTDLPAPPKPKAPAAPAAPPPKPKAPPAFKPPPPSPPASPAAPPSRPPPPAGPPAAPAYTPPPPAYTPPPPAYSPPSQPPPPSVPPPSGDPTGGMQGSPAQPEISASLQPTTPSPIQPAADPYAAVSSQAQYGAMGMQADMGGAPPDPGAANPLAAADPSAHMPTKTSPLIFAALAAVVLLGVSLTVWVLMRPSKPTVSKHEIVDAGPSPDALPASPDKAATDSNKSKADKAKKDELLGLTPAQRDALLEKSHKALASCYDKATKKDAKLAGTALTVEVTVSGKGKIDTVDVAGRDGDVDGKLVKCVQKAVKRWKVPKHPDKSAYQIKLGLTVE